MKRILSCLSSFSVLAVDSDSEDCKLERIFRGESFPRRILFLVMYKGDDHQPTTCGASGGNILGIDMRL